jgi:hypothetical protein
MTKAFASVDGSTSNNQLHNVVKNYGDWTKRLIDDGFEPYIATFKFNYRILKNWIEESGSSCDESMRKEITRVYSRFLTECVRYPNSPRNAHNRPILFGCQDFPVVKQRKLDLLINLPQQGMHWGSILMVPPRPRLKHSVKDHFEGAKRDVYIRPDHPLSQVHIEHITYRPSQAVAYTLKAILNRRAHMDDILVLPRSRAEVRG